ncbi:MAG: hypothetical protein IKI63_01915 [Clostridia bacterium]|nr:hypothetical protein [Clostridia bacterium]
MGNNRSNHAPDDGIVILKKTEPMMCGGTDAYQDTRAPKEIQSKDMILFDVTCSLVGIIEPEETAGERIDYLAAFAVPVKNGTLLTLEISRHGENAFSWALVKEPVFPALTALTREHELAKSNGFHSQTHGLPQNFGGAVQIRYASGETISFSDNQSPILSPKTARAIAAVFIEAMNGERVALPDVGSIAAIRFAEERTDGGYTHSTLKINPDGTGVNFKSTRYENNAEYESETPVDAETVAAIRQTVASCGMLAWEGLPAEPDLLGRRRSLTFVPDDGREILIHDAQTRLPRIGSGFFQIELEMTTKH